MSEFKLCHGVNCTCYIHDSSMSETLNGLMRALYHSTYLRRAVWVDRWVVAPKRLERDPMTGYSWNDASILIRRGLCLLVRRKLHTRLEIIIRAVDRHVEDVVLDKPSKGKYGKPVQVVKPRIVPVVNKVHQPSLPFI